jgi:hypothetical protein
VQTLARPKEGPRFDIVARCYSIVACYSKSRSVLSTLDHFLIHLMVISLVRIKANHFVAPKKRKPCQLDDGIPRSNFNWPESLESGGKEFITMLTPLADLQAIIGPHAVNVSLSFILAIKIEI